MKQSRLTPHEMTIRADEPYEAPLFISVALACRYQQRIVALPHVLSSISSYMNCIESKWTLESASTCEAVRLMDRLKRLNGLQPAIYFERKGK